MFRRPEGKSESETGSYNSVLANDIFCLLKESPFCPLPSLLLLAFEYSVEAMIFGTTIAIL